MIENDVQKLEPGSLITLYEVDLTNIGGPVLRYHGHLQSGDITWQGNEYSPWAVQASGFARKGSGQQASPSLSIGNIGAGIDGEPITGVVSSLCLAYDDCVGGRLIRRRTLAKYLDAINFPYGNPTADPDEHLPDEVWIIEQKTAENPDFVDFSLSSPIEFNGQQLSKLQIMANICSWRLQGRYRQAPCSYTGPYFDKNDQPTDDPTQDTCPGLITSCKVRFAAEQNVGTDWAVINWGGFASSGRLR